MWPPRRSQDPTRSSLCVWQYRCPPRHRPRPCCRGRAVPGWGRRRQASSPTAVLPGGCRGPRPSCWAAEDGLQELVTVPDSQKPAAAPHKTRLPPTGGDPEEAASRAPKVTGPIPGQGTGPAGARALVGRRQEAAAKQRYHLPSMFLSHSPSLFRKKKSIKIFKKTRVSTGRARRSEDLVEAWAGACSIHPRPRAWRGHRALCSFWQEAWKAVSLKPCSRCSVLLHVLITRPHQRRGLANCVTKPKGSVTPK